MTFNPEQTTMRWANSTLTDKYALFQPSQRAELSKVATWAYYQLIEKRSPDYLRMISRDGGDFEAIDVLFTGNFYCGYYWMRADGGFCFSVTKSKKLFLVEAVYPAPPPALPASLLAATANAGRP